MYMYFVNGEFTVGNELIERKIVFEGNIPIYSEITNVKNGYVFKTRKNAAVMYIHGFDYKNARLDICEEGLLFESNFTILWSFKVFDSLPLIESKLSFKGRPRSTKKCETEKVASGIESVEKKSKIELPSVDSCDAVGTVSRFSSLHKAELFDRTDNCDNLIAESEVYLYANGNSEHNGQIFTLCDRAEKTSLLIIRNSPCASSQLYRTGADLLESRLNLFLPLCGIKLSENAENEFTSAYSVTVGVCEQNCEQALFKKAYRESLPFCQSYIMSNTWGDRNRDAALCESFVIHEIEKAKNIGADIVQLDDGWQTGLTANSALASGGAWSEGYRNDKYDFWSVNKTKFPNGLEPIVKCAKENGVELGLWFSPDAADDYSHYGEDIETIYSLYEKFKVKYFKLDGINVKNKLCEKRLSLMLKTLKQLSGGDIDFNLDITAGTRFGYLSENSLGSIFVENRYTDWGNYFPHNTLRNLWQLSKWIPAQKLQFEVLNLRRNKDKYKELLSPSSYDIDYVFASVMVSNPLLWMEMTSLDEADAKKLAEIISVYKKYRSDFIEVTPYGACPDGFSKTGFLIKGNSSSYGVFLRENSDDGRFDVKIKQPLYTNDREIEILSDGFVLSKQRSLIFAEI